MTLVTNQQIHKPLNLEVFEKGMFSDAFSYDSNIKYQKTGKEIKAQLTSLKTKLEATKTLLGTQMMELRKSCTEAPDQPVSDWSYNGYKEKIGDLMGYSYELRYPAKNDSYGYGMAIKEEESTGMNCYQSYNDCLYKYIDACVDICQLETMENNLNDSEKYTLSNRQLTILGF